MKKHNLFLIPFFVAALLVGCKKTKEGVYDAKAIASIDKLSATIGDLKSCSYSLITEVTYPTANGKPVVHKESDVYMKGANKLQVFTKEDGKRNGYYYNSSDLSLFKFDNNIYESLKAPDNTIETITQVSEKYGVDFPATDFFYPTVTDDMMEHFDIIVDAGTANLHATLNHHDQLHDKFTFGTRNKI